MSRELKWEGKPWTTPGEPEEGGVYTLLNSSGCIALGMVFLLIENVIFMQYILIQVLLASLFHLPIDSTTCLLCLALENKEANEANKPA